MRTIPMKSRVGTVAGATNRNPLGTFLRVWMERRRQRVTLARLDEHLLDDIGLSSEDVARETAKPFWRP